MEEGRGLVAAYVLDANAVLAFLEDSASADKVEDILVLAQKEKALVFMSAINWGEAYLVHVRGRGEQASHEMKRLVRRFPIQIVEVDAQGAEGAARFKMRYKLHYADCFAGALAAEKKATLITSDSDFERAQGQLKILWLASGKKS